MSPIAHDAVRVYHELLDDDVAGASQRQLEDQLRRRGLFFGDRPLCTVLRPRWMSRQQYADLGSQAAVLLQAFRQIHRAAMADPTLRSQFRLLDWEEQLLSIDPGFAEPSPTSRLDAFFTTGEGGLMFTEYNAETPAGAGYNDVLSEVFLGLPIMREFTRRYTVQSLPVRHDVMNVLLDCFQQWSGTRARPRIAIVDWSDVPTYSEFLIFQDYFHAQGLECVIVDPRAMEFTGGKLLAEGGAVDLIYKRVLLSELVEQCGLDHPIFQALRTRAVCMVNPPQCKMLHKKASLAVLSDERNAALFTAVEAEAIDTHIPWTRVVEERRTLHDGRDVDLVPFCAEHQHTLVLKPNDEYGGKGIVLGWECDAGEWASALQAALAEPYVVQERINLPTEPYPTLVDGTVRITERMVDTAPYGFYGDYIDGCMTRIGTTSLLNVTAGGGSSVPTFVVAAR